MVYQIETYTLYTHIVNIVYTIYTPQMQTKQQDTGHYKIISVYKATEVDATGAVCSS